MSRYDHRGGRDGTFAWMELDRRPGVFPTFRALARFVAQALVMLAIAGLTLFGAWLAAVAFLSL